MSFCRLIVQTNIDLFISDIGQFVSKSERNIYVLIKTFKSLFSYAKLDNELLVFLPFSFLSCQYFFQHFYYYVAIVILNSMTIVIIAFGFANGIGNDALLKTRDHGITSVCVCIMCF